MTCSLDEPCVPVQDQPAARVDVPADNAVAPRDRVPADAPGVVAVCGW
ncbi:hypothetical protein [Kribbella capetownensis]|nr:hypothetical protein [Kribbella capetownensis]